MEGKRNQGCDGKKAFDSAEGALVRRDEINAKNAESGSKVRMRSYHCKICDKWHLTSMTNKKYQRTKDVQSRNAYREKKFVEVESNYWNKKFGINE